MNAQPRSPLARLLRVLSTLRPFGSGDAVRVEPRRPPTTVLEPSRRAQAARTEPARKLDTAHEPPWVRSRWRSSAHNRKAGT